MNNGREGVRGEMKEYTWGKLWWDGTKEFNNGVLQYSDGTLEFNGLTFYPNGVVIDEAGQQVGLVPEDDVTDDVPMQAEEGASQSDKTREPFETEPVQGATPEEPFHEDEPLIIEGPDEIESFYLPGSNGR